MSADGLISLWLLNLANFHSSTNKLQLQTGPQILQNIGTGFPKFGSKLKPDGEGLGPGLRAFDLARGRGNWSIKAATDAESGRGQVPQRVSGSRNRVENFSLSRSVTRG